MNKNLEDTDCLTNVLFEKKDIQRLFQEYGTPLYVFHDTAFVDNYKTLLNTFRAVYPKYNIAYSVKTNYTPHILQTIKKLGGCVEVVSSMEYELAQKVGYDNSKIIFNGPIKGEKLFEHLQNGGVANIDNLQELDDVINFSKTNNLPIKIAFRINVDIHQPFISRFGLDTCDSSKPSELDIAFTKVQNNPKIKVVGLHCHVGMMRKLDAWKERVKVLFDILDKYYQNITLEFVDFGSGMYSQMEPQLAKQFGDNLPSYSDYAQVVATQMLKRFGHLKEDKMPWLITEPGTTIVAGYMSFLTKVCSIKNVRGKTFATLDGSSQNIGSSVSSINFPISVFNFGDSKEYSNVDFVGYTCIENDVLYTNYCGKLSVGDIVHFRNVGGYSIVFKPPFISPNVAMISLENNKSKIIKRKENFEDIFSSFRF